LKQIEPNPWEKLEQQYPIGSKVKGQVRNIADFGVFLDVGGDIDGLIHISDLAWVQNFAHPSEVIKKNDDVEAVVLHVDPENERFSLGVKQLLDDPWTRISADFSEGTQADGTVAQINSAGAVIRLDEGIEGLIPVKDYPEELKAGDAVKIVVKKTMMRERRFILGLKS
jgi:small subunit ribosomal protein S1